MLYGPPLHARRANDFYRTPPDLAHGLMAGLQRVGVAAPIKVHDPCAGDGSLLDALSCSGGRSGSDLFPGNYPRDPRLCPKPVDARDPDALRGVLDGADGLISNPPYDQHALPIAESVVQLVREGTVKLAALLLPALWETASTPRRTALMRSMTCRIVVCWRPVWIEGTKGGGKLNHAWHVWNSKPNGVPEPHPRHAKRN